MDLIRYPRASQYVKTVTICRKKIVVVVVDLLAFVTMSIRTRPTPTKARKSESQSSLPGQGDQGGCRILTACSVCLRVLDNLPWNHAR